MTESVLWLWWCVVLGLAVNLGVQLLLSPGDPLVLLRRALVERLRAVEEAARSLGGLVASGPRPPRPSLTSLTVAGTSEMLTLLKMASLRHAWARQHRAELGALISLVDQLVTAAAALEASGPSAPAEDTRVGSSGWPSSARKLHERSRAHRRPRPDQPSSIEPPSVARRRDRSRSRGDGAGAARDRAWRCPVEPGQGSRPPTPASTRNADAARAGRVQQPGVCSVCHTRRPGLPDLLRALCRIRLSGHLHLRDHLLRRVPVHRGRQHTEGHT